jgi:hypothetical protein
MIGAMRRARLAHRGDGIAVATACDRCAHLIGSPEPEDGIRMTIVHSACVPGLEGQGWITTPDGHGPDDVACAHYHAENWIGGHGDDCCGERGAS